MPRGTSSSTPARRVRPRCRTCASDRARSARRTGSGGRSSWPCTTRGSLERLDVLGAAMPGATVLLNTAVAPERVWDGLPRDVQARLIEQRCRLFVIDGNGVATRAGLGGRINTVMQACFFALAKVLPADEAMAHIKQSVVETWGKRGPEVVRRNIAAIDAALAELHEVPVPRGTTRGRGRRRSAHAPDFVQRVTRLLLEGHGDRLPVSAFPPDGTWPTGTSRYEKRAIALDIPIWEPDLCVQCNRCSMICPHAAIRTKVFDPARLADAPPGFRSAREVRPGPRACATPCRSPPRTAPAVRSASRSARPRTASRAARRLSTGRWPSTASGSARRSRSSRPIASAPLAGSPSTSAPRCCAAAVRVLRGLRGLRRDALPAYAHPAVRRPPADRQRDGLLVDLRRQPADHALHDRCLWRGPAWANSLFEDNAEFGLGLRLGLDARRRRPVRSAAWRPAAGGAGRRLRAPGAARPGRGAAGARVADGAPGRRRVGQAGLARWRRRWCRAAVWIVGGDGWAYDIGYGGLDHVLASNRNMNVLVLDTEVYSNTGGQTSKATPLGAVAKFASAGKETGKKDLGLLAMTYGHVYVAEVAMQARSAQTVEAFLEAERHPGPSLIIAHSPCIAHGYDLVRSPAQQKRAIHSGRVAAVSLRPAPVERGEAPLVIDSGPPKLTSRPTWRTRPASAWSSCGRPSATRCSSTRPGPRSASATRSTSDSRASTCPRRRTMADHPPSWLGSTCAVRSSWPRARCRGRRGRRGGGRGQGRRGGHVLAVRGAARHRAARRPPLPRRARRRRRRGPTFLPDVACSPRRRALPAQARAPAGRGSTCRSLASLNGTTPGGWTRYARLEDAGADALELNLYEVATSPDETGAMVEARQLEVVAAVVAEVDIPVTVKLSPFYASVPAFVRRLDQAGARGVVVFNRFYQPDISLDTLDVDRRLRPSTPAELPLRLHALALLSPTTPLALGLQRRATPALDAAKAILCGAHVVQLASAPLVNGPAYVGVIRDELLAVARRQGATAPAPRPGA
ncbi:MAG: 2-oxoacid:acceptor oxidoreductase family protein [Myxococcales bacterium]|nr:2-oxoacid:acceptor oxidoreductase family protein [Myxococcales bacterium]